MRFFPLLLIAVIAYNIVAFGTGLAHHSGDQAMNAVSGALQAHVSVPMFSGDTWNFSVGDALVTLALVLLFIEIVKSTRTSSNQIVNHGLSLLTFVVALIEFIALHGFATSTFFFIMVMCLIDVVGGYTISIIAAEHNLGLARVSTD
jgi:hypothetical protein